MMLSTAYNVLETEFCDWDQALSRFANRTIYHSRAWIEMLCETHNLQPLLLRLDRDDTCVAVWPALVTRKGLLRIIGSPLPGWSTALMGPLVAPGVDVHEAISHFLEHQRMRRHSFFALKIAHPDDPLDLSSLGFAKVRTLDTYITDLTQPSVAIWSSMKSECRSRIRRAERMGVEIIEERSAEFLDQYWEMSVETFARSHIAPTHSREFLNHLWNHLTPVNAARAFSAVYEGARIATLLLIADHRTMYYWGGAAYTSYRHVPAHNLLHWHAMQAAATAGLARYDFVSTDGGPGRFKSTFGPNIETIGSQWERSSSAVVATLKKHYESFLLKRRRVSAPIVSGTP